MASHYRKTLFFTYANGEGGLYGSAIKKHFRLAKLKRRRGHKTLATRKKKGTSFPHKKKLKMLR